MCLQCPANTVLIRVFVAISEAVKLNQVPLALPTAFIAAVNCGRLVHYGIIGVRLKMMAH